MGVDSYFLLRRSMKQKQGKVGIKHKFIARQESRVIVDDNNMG